MLSMSKLPVSRECVLKDYYTAFLSRQLSLLGRKEVLSGKAKFGIFGDGKEVAQVALANYCQPGDWRSGYYRDQTLMLALGNTSAEQFFAQLYAHADIIKEPQSGGRQMNCHYASRLLDAKGEFLDQLSQFNSSADLSPTGAQMARLLGIAYASKLYRHSKPLKNWRGSKKFSNLGNEIAIGTIGNASTSEGVFWETMNAAGVLQVPLLLLVWDDGYGISVPNRYQTTKSCISSAFSGFASDHRKGFSIHRVAGYDYLKLLTTIKEASNKVRTHHEPCLIHVTDMTQPQGHSTSGSHERYKSKKQLEYEKKTDNLVMMRAFIIDNIAVEQDLVTLEQKAKKVATEAMQTAWQAYQSSLVSLQKQAHSLVAKDDKELSLQLGKSFLLKNTVSVVRQAILKKRKNQHNFESLQAFYQQLKGLSCQKYNTYLLADESSEDKASSPLYAKDSVVVDGRVIIKDYFAQLLQQDPRVFIIGEDVGQLGGVNLEFEGLAQKFDALQITDTGIREATILGQGIGAALRGLRPIVDIQYLDYLIYALQLIADDLATLHYRSAGGQVAPVIIRTKGHRLEGIWHTGSPLGMLLGSLRGLHLCVPRNCVQAVGMYQTLMQTNNPALVIEVLNGYRLKEKLPSNLGTFAVPLGVPERIVEGKDVTLITYGANVRLAQIACLQLQKLGISVELFDVQTLLPFDTQHLIRQSLEKTHALVCLDEDVPAGASAFMLQQVLEQQNGYDYLDSPPKTLTAQEHRGAYGSDGDYFSKPSSDDIVETIYNLMHERYPQNHP